MQTTKRGAEARKANSCDHNVRQRWDRQGIEEVLQAEDWELLLTEPPLGVSVKEISPGSFPQTL